MRPFVNHSTFRKSATLRTCYRGVKRFEYRKMHSMRAQLLKAANHKRRHGISKRRITGMLNARLSDAGDESCAAARWSERLVTDAKFIG
jgi:hypothetical protein